MHKNFHLDNMESMRNRQRHAAAQLEAARQAAMSNEEPSQVADPQRLDRDEPISDGEENHDQKKVLVGMVAESKDLFAKFDKDKNRSWSQSPPDGLEAAAENSKTLKYAVLVRKMKPKQADSIKPLVIDSIVVQSPHLKRVLGRVFDGYPGIVTDLSRLIFSAPFECFVHRWSEFAAARFRGDQDADAQAHLDLLYDIMYAELKEIIQLRDEYLRNRAITWEHVWTLFAPESVVLTSVRGKPMAVRFEKGEYKELDCGEVYDMVCHSVDWDGKKMGWANVRQMIQKYTGTVPFSELLCCPLEYSPDPSGTEKKLVARGRVFESLAGIHYRYYDGIAAYHPKSDPRKLHLEPVSCRIVIDSASWSRANPENSVDLRSLHRKYDPTGAEAPGQRSIGRRQAMHIFSGSYETNPEEEADQPDEIPQAALSEEHLLLASPVVRGYSLISKKWMHFLVDDISDIKFDANAFDSLVLEQEKKKLILAFAQNQVKNKTSFDDVITGKGRGIIIMLSGGPGIGKTLTAESVAEEMQTPLYIMSAGDLGSHSYEVEYNLNNILKMVASWNAVLLLDECDIFLEQRTPNGLDRNKIVGIFLRMLEYYEGILFLTTNRVKNIDAAFHSRIHLSLHYPDLNAEARATVWKTFLGKSGALMIRYEVTDDEIARLSQLELNGRQIKNALKMASLLPLEAEEPLKFEHLHSVLRIQGYSL
ncbi:ATPase family AAA domain-containing protein [Paramyrothecium foliicola]|nr:ATPase family AAA domain-containing protein [Paramyrothecium foliicola]